MQALGREVWIVGLQSRFGDEATLGCIRRGKMFTELEFPSLPVIAQDKRFWDVVERLCKQCKVTDLIADSYCSLPFELPALPGEVNRRVRHEFVLQLNRAKQAWAISSNHLRNIKKAKMAGMTIRSTQEKLEWISEHVAMMRQSLDRRARRGESVSCDIESTTYSALIKNGAAKLFQAVIGSEVMSSVFILLSPRVAYYHSAGTSAGGMKIGASHFLIYGIADILSDEGLDAFSLGGASEGSSLARFKAGFGADVRVLHAANCYIGPIWKREVRSAIRLIRSDYKQWLSVLRGSSSRFSVFEQKTDAFVRPSAPITGVRFDFLNEHQLTKLSCPIDDPDFRSRQVERLHRFRESYCYAVYVNDEVAHVSWLLPRSAQVLDIPRVLELTDEEGEITGCETIAAFRGRGLYVYAIECLMNIARERGIRRIYMKTLETNVTSQRGIIKAGLIPVGSVRLIHPPLRPSVTMIRREVESL
jgi:hypothetical protein